MRDTVIVIWTQTLARRTWVTQSSEEEDDGDGGVPDHWGITRFAVQQRFPSSPLAAAGFYRQYLMGCYASLLHNRCHHILVAALVGKLSYRNGEKGVERRKEWYVISALTYYGCLPYKMALVMLTILPGVWSRGELVSHWVRAFHWHIVFEKKFSTLL